MGVVRAIRCKHFRLPSSNSGGRPHRSRIKVQRREEEDEEEEGGQGGRKRRDGGGGVLLQISSAREEPTPVRKCKALSLD